jgi:RNA polymerase sigma-70 factor, ECF subfamily
MLRTRVEFQVPSDQILIEQTRAGNQEALGELISRHYRACFNVAASILRDRANAQDAVQDAMWKAVTHLDQYRQEAPFSTWLIRIVLNRCLLQLRSRKCRQWVSCDIESGTDERPPLCLRDVSPDPEQQLVNHERREIVLSEIQLLPPLLRNALLFHDMQELPLEEIAQRLQITVGAIKSRLLRARAELKKRVVARYRESITTGINLNERRPRPGRTETCQNPSVDELLKSPEMIPRADADRELPTNRRVADRPNREDKEKRRYPNEIPCNSVWLTLREQPVAGAGREIQL